MPLQPAAAPLRGFDVKLRTRSHAYRLTILARSSADALLDALTLLGLAGPICAVVLTLEARHG